MQDSSYIEIAILQGFNLARVIRINNSQARDNIFAIVDDRIQEADKDIFTAIRTKNLFEGIVNGGVNKLFSRHYVCLTLIIYNTV